MSIILRLQGLDVKAGSEDIRSFFKGLHIPDGGVYIVGGSLREAFIAFTSERDGQIAMQQSGRFLKESLVTLHISSLKQLEQKLKSFLKKRKPSPTQIAVKSPQQSSDANVLPLNAEPHAVSTPNPPLPAKSASLPQHFHPDTSDAVDSSTAFLLGMCTVLQGLQSSHQQESKESSPVFDFSKTCNTVVSNEASTQEKIQNSNPGYVRLFGLPASTTKETICNFFKGLTVQEVIVNVKLGIGHGCLVMFPSKQEAFDALLFNQQSVGPFCVEVRRATEKMWIGALQECGTTVDVGGEVKPDGRHLKETENHKRKSTAQMLKRQSVDRFPLKSLKKRRANCEETAFDPAVEYTLMVSNLPKTMTKTDIKQLLGCPNIAHTNVLHLLDKERNRTDTTFVIFNSTEDYEYALNLNGCHLGSEPIDVSTITKTTMWDMMNKATKKMPNGKRITQS